MDDSNAESEPSDSLAPADRGRYAVLALQDLGTVVYDRDNPKAWIQSDATTTIADAR
jgi:hypothetical protein